MNKHSVGVLTPLLLMNWIAFAQVISFQGLAIWVVGGSLVVALIVQWLGSLGLRLLAIIAGALLTFAIPALAETFGGNSAGPITRASLISCGTTFAMALILNTRYSMWLLVPALLMFGGALGLGAVEPAIWIVGSWVVMAGATVAMLGPYRANELRARERMRSFLVVLCIIGVVSVIGAAACAPFMRTPWTIPGNGSISLSAAVPSAPITPSPLISQTPDAIASENLAINNSPPPVAPAQEVVITKVEPTPSQLAQPSRPWLLIAVGILAILLIFWLTFQLVLRVLVGLHWWFVRLRLRRGTPKERASGAWQWLQMRYERYDQPLPIHASPDVAAHIARTMNNHDFEHVAEATARIYFDPNAELSPQEIRKIWRSSRKAGKRPAQAQWRLRWLWLAVPPAKH